MHRKSIPIEMDAPEFAEAGEADIVHDFAEALPVLTTLQKLGLPTHHWKRFAEPIHRVVFLRQDNPARANILEELGWIADQITEAIEQRRESPRDDMITCLLQSRPFGEPVTDRAVHEMVMLTMQGGFDTAGSAISGALIHLDRDREARQRLIDDPALVRTAVEEFLRIEAHQFALAPTATCDTEVGGCPVQKGERPLLVWASGNRAADVFEQADEVVLDRLPNKHMSFGLGADGCLGSTLARQQIQIALRTVLRRLPDYEIDHDRLVRQSDRCDTRNLLDADPIHAGQEDPLLSDPVLRSSRSCCFERPRAHCSPTRPRRTTESSERTWDTPAGATVRNCLLG